MEDDFGEYILSLYQYIPKEVFNYLLIALCVGTIFFIAARSLKNRLRWYSGFLLIEYILLLFSSMVFFRIPKDNYGFELMPFWSYAAIIDGKIDLLRENIFNLVGFVPIGLLFSIITKVNHIWKVILFGCSVSMMIELLQFHYGLGFAELDDVIHNTLGCLLGYLLYCVMVSISMKRVKGTAIPDVTKL